MVDRMTSFLQNFSNPNTTSKNKKVRSNLAIIIELIAVVMVWRGVWSLLDTFLFPNNHILSSIVGIIIGIIILLFDDRLLKELEHQR